jgi:acetyltransferase-like isoleucine patch superfamily enzyme
MGRFSKTALAAYRGAADARNKMFALAVGGAFAGFGRKTVIQLPVRLDGEARIVLGDGVFVGANSWLQVIGDDPQARLTLGDGTAASGHVVLAAAHSVTIGRRVLMARGVYIADHGHAFDDLSLPVIEQGLAHVAAVEIADGAWLGENVVVCPGVRVGRNAVVGANSVVTRDVPDGCVAVGAPARVIREIAEQRELAVTAR